MRHTIRILVMISVVLLVAVGCASGKEARQEQPSATAGNEGYTLLAPKSAPILPALWMKEGNKPEWSLEVKTWDTIDQLLALLQKNEGHFTAAPLNVAAQLKAKGIPLQLVHVNTWGTLYLVSTDGSVKHLEDLQGQTLFVPHQGGTPEVLTKHLLKETGMEGKIELKYAAPPEIAQLMIAGTVKHAVLPEPSLSGVRLQLKDQLAEIIDFQKEWTKRYGQGLPQAGIVVNRQWAEANPKAVAEFQKRYEQGAANVVAKPAETAALAEPVLGMKLPVIQSALGKMKIEVVPAQAAKPGVERYFQILMASDPKTIGGSLPDDSFYYKP